MQRKWIKVEFLVFFQGGRDESQAHGEQGTF